MTRTAELISYSMTFTEFIRAIILFFTTRILKQYCLVSRKKGSQRGALERYDQSVTGVVSDFDESTLKLFAKER